MDGAFDAKVGGMSPKEDKFSAREVVALVEDLRSEFRVVSEVVLPLREDMAEVKERLTKVEDRLIFVEDGLKGLSGRVTRLETAVTESIPPLSRRVSRLETKAGF